MIPVQRAARSCAARSEARRCFTRLTTSSSTSRVAVFSTSRAVALSAQEQHRGNSGGDDGNSSSSASSNTREAILEAALTHVNEEGWTADALAAGANDLGLPSAAQGMFQHGPLDLVYHVMNRAHEHTVRELEGSELLPQQLSANDRIKLGVMARIRYLAPFRTTWAQVGAGCHWIAGWFDASWGDTLWMPIERCGEIAHSVQCGDVINNNMM